jgi:hypothetical protein
MRCSRSIYDNEIGVALSNIINTRMSNLSFKEYITVLEQSNSLKDCNFIKDAKLRAECKKLHKRSKGGVRMYGSLGGGPAGGGQ